MMQKLEIVRKENDILNDFKGLSFNIKTRLQISRILDEIHHKALHPCPLRAVCYVLDSVTKEILGVGGSSLLKNKKTGEFISDLITDNYGEWFEGWFTQLANNNTLKTLKDDTGANVSVTSLRSDGTTNASFSKNNVAANLGIQYQVGQGITPPARANFQIETPFVNAPENAKFLSGISVYDTSLGNLKAVGSINAGGAGTISESGFFTTWVRSAFGTNRYLLARDAISPGVSFIAAQSIALEYTWTI